MIKWIKTADRAPTDDDSMECASGDRCVVAMTKYAHGYYPEMQLVEEVSASNSKYYPYWLPLQPWLGIEP